MADPIQVGGNSVTVGGNDVTLAAGPPPPPPPPPPPSLLVSQSGVTALYLAIPNPLVSQVAVIAPTSLNANIRTSQIAAIVLVNFMPPKWTPQRYRLPCLNWCIPYLIKNEIL